MEPRLAIYAVGVGLTYGKLHSKFLAAFGDKLNIPPKDEKDFDDNIFFALNEPLRVGLRCFGP